MSIYSVIQALKAQPKKNKKIELLKKEKGNDLLKKVLVAALHPYKQYYIKKIPDYTPKGNDIAREMRCSLEQGISMLPTFSDRMLTGHAAIEFLQAMLACMTPEDADIMVRVVKKNLDCGVQESTVSKVWPDLIPTYPCLLAKSYDEKTIKKMVWPCFSQLKADGMRNNAFVDLSNQDVVLRGRSGREVNLKGALDADLLLVAEHIKLKGPVVIDGELVVVNPDGTIMDRKKGNGILNKAIKGTISASECAMVRMRVWDVIPQKDFDAYRCETPYVERWVNVSSAVAQAHNRMPLLKIELIEQIEVANLQEAEAHFNELLKRGEEGTILKHPEHIWEDKRSYGLIKMKAERDADLKIIAWVEGTNKYTGMLGALIGESSDGKVQVSVGSGFTDEERATLKEEDVLDKVMTIVYNERIKSKDREDVDSLFLPRFVEIREDKKVANSSKEIK